MPLKYEYDIVVVGGGVVGVTFVIDLALACPTLKIGLIEKSEFQLQLSQLQLDLPLAQQVEHTPQFASRIYAITPQNIMYLESLGVSGLDNLTKIALVNRMLVYGDENSNIDLTRQLGQQLFLAKILEGDYLQHCVNTKLVELDNVKIIYDRLNDVKIMDSCALLIGTSGASYTTKLIVAADGVNSFVRNKVGLNVANMDYLDYKQSGVVANFKCELSHNNTAYQWFMHDGILACLPLPDNHISIVWACSDPEVKLQLSTEEFTASVEAVAKVKLGSMNLISQRCAFPLRLNLVHEMYANRVVLIGDAAHTIHPLAGQGLNLGIQDARVLAQILSKVQKYQLGDVGLLAKYNNIRLPAIRKMQLTCHVLQRLFSANSKILKYLRNTGLNLVNALPIVKKQLIKQSNSVYKF